MFRPNDPGPSNTKSKNKKNLEATAGGLITTLTIVKESLDGISPPGLKAAVGGLLEILKAAKKTYDNTQDLVELDTHLRKLNRILKTVAGKKETEFSLDLSNRIEQLASDINIIVDSSKDLSSQSSHTKFFLSQDNTANIARLNKSIDTAIQTFQLESLMAIESRVGQLALSSTPSYQVLQDPQDPLLILRPRADEARFDSAARTIASRCFEGTRSELLQKIYDWADNPNSKAIYWLCGLAGTGKSTIAQTVAEAFSQRRVLGASFFFSRDSAERSNPYLVFTTIAYQLGRFHPSFCSRISASVRAYPDSCTSQPATQMEKLIAGPLRGVTDAPNTVVIVMDALDECSNEKLVREILILLEMTIRELPFHAKVFVTSRPDAHIRARFSEDVMQTVSEASILHDIDLSVVQSDIRIYLMHQLREVGKEILKSDTWPTQAEVEALVERAGGLFIYASASVMYIGDTDHREPRERLKVLLDDSPISGESPYEEIDKLYRHILASSLPKTRTGALDVAKKLQPIIGTIVTLLDPLPVHAMEKLMSVEETYIQPKLRPLHSILLVPDDPEDLIRIFHKSFPDFMTNPQRCQDPRFLVVRRDFFTQLALQCILLMNSSLHKNMCDIQYPFSMNSDISNLELLLKAKVGTHVLYACRFWAFHLQHADPKDELREAMTIFVTTKLLYWLEVLSLSQHLDHAQPSLKMAQVWYKEEEPKRPGLLQKMMPVLEPLQVFNEALNSAEGKRLQSKTPVKILLSDCQSLLLRFNQSITKSACHIYHSALGLAPYCPLYKQYQKEAEHSVRVLSRAYTWDSLITIFRGQFQRIGAICFSPDGLKIASGSDDRRIYLWDSNTGITIKKLMGHTEGINSLSFSSDGLVLASASHDNTVKLWDSTTGTQLHTLHGHSDSVSSVCFSPKVPHLAQQYVVSGSHDGTICVSDAATGAHIKKIDAQYASEGATIRVLSVSLSPDGSFIASGSQDAMVYIWEFATGSCHKQLKGHNESVGSVCFSPDGLMVASGSEDQLVYLWDFPNGTQIRALKGHSGAVYTVCFSPDGMTIASASADKTIHLWSVHTGSLIKLLKGSPGRVYSACFSPDGLRIASGSRDKMLHIWDSTPPQGLQTKTPKRHLSAIRAVCFSSDGTRVASGSDDGTVQLWDFSTAKPINIFNDHDRAVRFIAFSPDGRYLTSLDIYENLICWKHKSFKRTTIPGVTTVTDLAKWLAETKCTPINSVRGTLSLVQQAVIFNHPNGSQHTICVLPYSDILCHAVSGYSLAVGTQTGDVHLLDFSQTVTLLC